MRAACIILVGAALWTTLARAETIEVKYFGPIELGSYTCNDVTRSSFIRRVCHDPRKGQMVISLHGTYYAYCDIPGSVVEELKWADSMGQFYNAHVKGRFACR